MPKNVGCVSRETASRSSFSHVAVVPFKEDLVDTIQNREFWKSLNK